MNLPELFETWRAWNERSVLDTALRRAERAGEQERAAQLRELLADQPRVPAVDALAAQHELTELLSGWRWHTVTAAREEGATWDAIAAATRTDPDTARQSYRERVAEAEHAAAELDLPLRDADRYRAASRDDHDTTTTEPIKPLEGDQAMPDHDFDRQPEMIAGPDLDDQGFVVGEIALPGGLPPDEDQDDDADVPRWDEAFSIADRDGYVMFDPTKPGGFRSLAPDERTALSAAAAGSVRSESEGSEQLAASRKSSEPAEGAGWWETDEGRARIGPWAAENADPAKAVDDSHPDDPEKLQQRLDDLRVRLTGYTWREGVDRDEALADRRQQLGYWYALDGDDQGAEQGLDSADGVDGAYDPDPRWYR